MGNTAGSKTMRGDDVYETPPEAIEALCDVETLPSRVWEPFLGPSDRIGAAAGL
jgi:hypothetical protein